MFERFFVMSAAVSGRFGAMGDKSSKPAAAAPTQVAKTTAVPAAGSVPPADPLPTKEQPAKIENVVPVPTKEEPAKVVIPDVAPPLSAPPPPATEAPSPKHSPSPIPVIENTQRTEPEAGLTALAGPAAEGQPAEQAAPPPMPQEEAQPIHAPETLPSPNPKHGNKKGPGLPAKAATPKAILPPGQMVNMVILKEGFMVDGRWKVVRLLGKGSFGAVYKCEDAQKEFKGFMAIKSESTKTPEQSQVLKLEVAVLKALRGCKHACKLYARGRNDDYNYIVMSVLGPSLLDMRKKNNWKFSIPTTTRLVYQCCRAVRDMHNIDWIHRDVKPANFAMGGSNKTNRHVYIFDFGLSRRFRSDTLKLRPGREAVKFRGTKRYCSINVHKKEEFGRHDDLISILYMIVEFAKGRLPWNEVGDGKELLKWKEDTGTSIYQGLPLWLPKVHEYLHSIKYDTQPDYAMLETPLLNWIYTKGHNKKPLDWEMGLQMCYQSVADVIIGDQGKSEDVKLTDVGVEPQHFTPMRLDGQHEPPQAPQQQGGWKQLAVAGLTALAGPAAEGQPAERAAPPPTPQEQVQPLHAPGTLPSPNPKHGNKKGPGLPPKPATPPKAILPPGQMVNMVILKEGFMVDGRWKVVRLLGKGSFGAVYKCEDAQKEFKGFMAIKSESTKTPEQSQVLKLEVAVLKALRGCKHACKLYARGRNDDYNYIVMSVLGPSLLDMRKKNNWKFSIPTTTRLVYQCCRAVRDMHNIDWIHRDVKPANFAMGGSNKTNRHVYIFDFGLSRRFRSDTLKLRPGREAVKFRGTKRYCSIHVHKKEEFGRHDDLISILYMIVEFAKGRLPWNEVGDGKELLKWKEDTGTSIYQGLPVWLAKVHEYLHSIKYDTQPDYDMLETPLLNWIYTKGHNKKPLDWEMGLQMCYQSVADVIIGDQGKSEDIKNTDVAIDPQEFKSYPIHDEEGIPV